MDWTKKQTKDDIVEWINTYPKSVKVLAKDGLKLDNEGAPCEGVFVLLIDGDENNGLGILISNIISIEFPAVRGDFVQFMTLNKDHKPYITTVLDGSLN